MPPDRDVTVEVLTWFDPRVFVSEEFAGSMHRVRIGERDAELTVALDGADAVSQTAARPALREPTFPEPRALGNEAALTSLAMKIPVPEAVLAMDAILLRFTDPALPADLELPTDPTKFFDYKGPRALSADIGQWMSIVRDWVAGWTHSPREHPSRSPTPAIEAVLPDDPEAPPMRAGGRPASTAVLPVRTATQEQMRAAFAAASARLSFPLQHKLLAAASVHFSSGEYREAVIDGCSAAEVALAELARTALHSNGYRSKDIKDMVDGARGVVDLYRMVAASRTRWEVSVGAVTSNLAHPRNRAAHDGEPLDAETAMEAIHISRALLELTPLPTPEEIEAQATARKPRTRGQDR